MTWGGLINSISLEMATLERGGRWEVDQIMRRKTWKTLEKKTFEKDPQAAKILRLNFQIVVQVKDITKPAPPIAEGLKSHKQLQK